MLCWTLGEVLTPSPELLLLWLHDLSQMYTRFIARVSILLPINGSVSKSVLNSMLTPRFTLDTVRRPFAHFKFSFAYMHA